jgi:hypothetical protein
MTTGGGSRLRPFLLGGILGGVAAVVAGRMREQRRAARTAPAGLAAFERAPCYQELVEAEQERTPPKG